MKAKLLKKIRKRYVLVFRKGVYHILDKEKKIGAYNTAYRRMAFEALLQLTLGKSTAESLMVKRYKNRNKRRAIREYNKLIKSVNSR